MRKLLLLGLIIGFLGGCASLPPESVTAQEKIGSGIETARQNQLLLIDKFAEEAKATVNLKFKQAIPAALKKKYGAKDSYSQVEVESLLVEYGADIQAELKKIDDKRVQLVRDTNQFFDELGSINTLNLGLLKSAVELNKVYKAAFDQIKDRAKSSIPEILSK